MKKLNFLSYFLLTMLLALASCSSNDSDEWYEGPNVVNPGGDTNKNVKGFFLLNQGQWNSNNATLDYYNSKRGALYHDVFRMLNPNIAHGLGDAGNAIKVWGGKVFIVMNGSNMIVVLDAKTGAEIGTVDVPNCRDIEFAEGFGFVTSFNNLANSSDANAGALVKFDPSDDNFAIMQTIALGRQPEGIAMRDNMLYVAVSGGFGNPSYENIISVVNPATMKKNDQDISLGNNLNPANIVTNGADIFVQCNGNYFDVQSSMAKIDKENKVTTIDVRCSNFAVSDEYIYVISTQWDIEANKNVVSYNKINKKTLAVEGSFMDTKVQNEITYPYSVSINPETKDIFVTDARDFVTDGSIYCLHPDGKLKWSAKTGIIPMVIAFTGYELESIDLL